MQTTGDGPEHITPLLFDNGKPQHLNKEEINNIKTMINQIGVQRYNRIVDGCVYFDDPEEQFTSSKRPEWTLKEVYNTLCKH